MISALDLTEIAPNISESDLQAILDGARHAAHEVERPAAPVTTYLMGMAVAREIAYSLTDVGRVESEPLHSCDKRVCAENLAALTDLPFADSSSMDGWAVNGTGPWTLTDAQQLERNQASVVTTGGALPTGTQAVVRTENGTLPGNPLAAIVALTTLVQPMINRMLGQQLQPFISLGSSASLKGGRSGTRLVPGSVVDAEFIPAEFSGSAMLRGLSRSTGFAIVTSQVEAGNSVDFLPLSI